MNTKKNIFTGVFIAALLFAACHGDGYFGDPGTAFPAGKIDKPAEGEYPYLDSLEALRDRSGGKATISPSFDSKTNLYTVNSKSFNGMEVLHLEATSARFKVEYVTGEDFLITHGYAIVAAINGDIRNEYIISVKYAERQTATLSKLEFTDGAIYLPGEFNPGGMNYTVRVLAGVTTVIPAAVPTYPGSRVIFSQTPISLPGGNVDKDSPVLMTINVACIGYNVGTYTILLHNAEPQDSLLWDLQFSTGSLSGPAVNGDKLLTFVPNIKYKDEWTLIIPPDTPLVFNGTVKSGVVKYPQGETRANGTNYIAKPQNGAVYTVTANNGIGFKDTDYKITIKVDASAKFIRLSMISPSVDGNNEVAGNAYPWILYKREGGNRIDLPVQEADIPMTQNYNDFHTDNRTYELYFRNDRFWDADVSGTLELADVLPEGEVTKFPGNLSATQPNEPVRFLAKKEGYLPTTYWVFVNWNDSYKPEALLKNLEVVGAALDPAFSPETFEYTIQAPRLSNIILKGTVGINGRTKEEENWYNVIHSPEAGVSSLKETTMRYIKVDGGEMYRASHYAITVEMIPQKNPHIDTMTVKKGPDINDGAGVPVPLEDYKYVYNIEIPYEGISDNTPIEYMMQNTGDVSEIWYSFTMGRDWAQDPEMNGFNGSEFQVKQGESKLAQIKVICKDGNTVIYSIVCSRLGRSDSSLVLQGINVNGAPIKTFQPEVRSYVVMVQGAEEQTVTGILPNTQDMLNATVSYALAGGLEYSFTPIPVSIEVGDVREVIVRVQLDGRNNDYSVFLSRSKDKYRVLEILNDEAASGTYEITPVFAMTNGVPAGETIFLSLKPINGAKVAFTPVIYMHKGGEEYSGSIWGTPEPSGESNFYFLMPIGDVDITIGFEPIGEQGNQIKTFKAVDGNGNSDGVMRPWSSTKTEQYVVVTTPSVKLSFNAAPKVRITYTIAGSTANNVSDMELKSPTTGQWISKMENFQISGLRVGQMVEMLITITPEDPSIDNNFYIVHIYRIQEKWTDGYAGYYKTITAPVDGYYSILMSGGGGGDQGDDHRQGGMGGTSFITVYLKKGYIIRYAVGGGGARKKDGDYGERGWPNGGRGGPSQTTWQCGGGGGGGSMLEISKNNGSSYTLYLAAGGGGGGSVGHSTSNNGGFGGGGWFYGGKGFQGHESYVMSRISGGTSDINPNDIDYDDDIVADAKAVFTGASIGWIGGSATNSLSQYRATAVANKNKMVYLGKVFETNGFRIIKSSISPSTNSTSGEYSNDNNFKYFTLAVGYVGSFRGKQYFEYEISNAGTSAGSVVDPSPSQQYIGEKVYAVSSDHNYKFTDRLYYNDNYSSSNNGRGYEDDTDNDGKGGGGGGYSGGNSHGLGAKGWVASGDEVAESGGWAGAFGMTFPDGSMDDMSGMLAGWKYYNKGNGWSGKFFMYWSGVTFKDGDGYKHQDGVKQPKQQ